MASLSAALSRLILSRTRRFIIAHFSEGWADEAQAGFARSPITTFLAVHEKRIVGFASVDATAKGFFGPTGVDPAHRNKGIGAALLLAALHDLKNQGYGYGIIGSAGPVDFYVKAVNAIVIPDSSPRHLLRYARLRRGRTGEILTRSKPA